MRSCTQNGKLTDSASAPELAFDHVGIVVPELSRGCGILTGMLGPLRWTRRFEDSGLGVTVRFALDAAGMTYELIAPFGEMSVALRVLQTGNNILNQIAYRTTSLEHSINRLRAHRYAVPVGMPTRALAFNGARVQFLMTGLGVLIELIESDRIVHRFEEDFES